MCYGAQDELDEVTPKSKRYWLIVWVCMILLLPIMCFRLEFIAKLPKYDSVIYSKGYDEAIKLIESTIDTPGNNPDKACLNKIR